MDRIIQLVKILNEAAEAYYQQDNEIISNYEYDKMYNELLDLESSTGIVLPNSPTQSVGYTVVKSLQKVEHQAPMLSLDKTKDVDRLASFLDSKDGILSFKLDGLTLIVKYENGFLKQAVTRGNGNVGEDVTHNVKHFSNIPYKIPYKDKLILRGEAVITYTEFEKINSSLEESAKYKNPRNLCSGTVRQLNSEIFSKRDIKYFVFSIVEATNIDFGNLKSNALEWVKEQGFKIIEYRVTNMKEVYKHVEEFKDKIISYDIPSDGLVLTYNDISYSIKQGTTSKFPKDSIAFKWEDEVKETKLINIEWNTSRTGLINPMAVFEPVDLEGTVVSRASLHNLSIMENLKLGIGDTIKVYKANMIIPQVAENLTCSNTVDIPKYCKVCNGDTEVIQQSDIKTLYCTNPNCKAQQIKLLSHFVSRNAMNIEGLSESTLEKFVEKGFIKDYSDIYKLNTFEQEIKQMKGFGEKSYNRLISSIEKSKHCKIHNFIYAMGINNVGLSNAKILCKFYDYDIEKIKKANIEELVLIEGFGDVIAESLYKFFNNSKNIYIMNEALKYLEIEMTKDTNSLLNGLIFVITGSVEKFKNRKELQDLIEEKGGKVQGAISSKTNYLINNDKESLSSKNKKAKKLNIPILNEKEFLDKFKILN